MNPQLQTQVGVLFEREARDAQKDRRGPAESRRLQDVGARLRRTSGFVGDPFGVEHVGVVLDAAPSTARGLSGWIDSSELSAAEPVKVPVPPSGPAPPVQPPPPRPAIVWGPSKPTAPPKPAAPPCTKC